MACSQKLFGACRSILATDILSTQANQDGGSDDILAKILAIPSPIFNDRGKDRARNSGPLNSLQDVLPTQPNQVGGLNDILEKVLSIPSPINSVGRLIL